MLHFLKILLRIKTQEADLSTCIQPQPWKYVSLYNQHEQAI